MNQPLGDPAAPGDDRDAAPRRRLQRHQAERLALDRREGEDIVFAVKRHQLRLRPDAFQPDVVAEVELADRVGEVEANTTLP